VDDFPPFSEDITPLLGRIQNPSSLPLALQTVRRYRERVQDLLAAARRAEAERVERELELNRFAGFSEEASRKIALNDLAFFRAELARELHESVRETRDRLRQTLLRLIDDETE
jgi:hypothetical protein